MPKKKDEEIKPKKLSEVFNEKVELDRQINALIEDFIAKNPTVYFYEISFKEGCPLSLPLKLKCDFDLATYNFSTE